MGRKKEILSNLTQATSLLMDIKKESTFAEVRRRILLIDYAINKAAMIVREGKNKQTSDSGLNLCGVNARFDTCSNCNHFKELIKLKEGFACLTLRSAITTPPHKTSCEYHSPSNVR